MNVGPQSLCDGWDWMVITYVGQGSYKSTLRCLYLINFKSRVNIFNLKTSLLLQKKRNTNVLPLNRKRKFEGSCALPQAMNNSLQRLIMQYGRHSQGHHHEMKGKCISNIVKRTTDPRVQCFHQSSCFKVIIQVLSLNILVKASASKSRPNFSPYVDLMIDWS